MNNSPEFNEPNESEYEGWQNQPLPNKSPNFWEQFIRLFTPSTPEEWRRTVLGIVGVMVIICICSLPSLAFNYAFQDSFQFNNFENSFFETATASARTCRAYAAQTTNIYTEPDVNSLKISTMYTYGALASAPVIKRKSADWVQIRLPSGTLGWVSKFDVRLQGSQCSTVPIEP